jgi:hypothetical protein
MVVVRGRVILNLQPFLITNGSTGDEKRRKKATPENKAKENSNRFRSLAIHGTGVTTSKDSMWTELNIL